MASASSSTLAASITVTVSIARASAPAALAAARLSRQRSVAAAGRSASLSRTSRPYGAAGTSVTARTATASNANDFVTAHDSPYFSIRYYGDALPQYLATHEEYAAAPVLAELAQWEWAMTSVFDAADAAPLGHAALERISPPQWAQAQRRTR